MEKPDRPVYNTRTCRDCRFFDTITEIKSANQMTVCRLHPPTAVAQLTMSQRGEPQWVSGSAWPVVSATDWCNEHKVRLQS
jgi:hypothetical protein